MEKKIRDTMEVCRSMQWANKMTMTPSKKRTKDCHQRRPRNPLFQKEFKKRSDMRRRVRRRL
jgi:hypothetical protein